MADGNLRTPRTDSCVTILHRRRRQPGPRKPALKIHGPGAHPRDLDDGADVFLRLSNLRRRGMRAVPEADEGLDIGALEHIFKTTDAEEEEEAPRPGCQRAMKSARQGRKIHRHVIYAVPTFANPSGKVMSQARREALFRHTRRQDARSS